jgi:hypothetical protein
VKGEKDNGSPRTPIGSPTGNQIRQFAKKDGEEQSRQGFCESKEEIAIESSAKNHPMEQPKQNVKDGMFINTLLDVVIMAFAKRCQLLQTGLSDAGTLSLPGGFAIHALMWYHHS